MMSANYKWKITKDHLHESFEGDEFYEGESCAGVEGPSNCFDEEVTQQVADEKGLSFAQWRCYDDDGVLYTEGVMMGPGEDIDSFAPLHDYCMPALGCTSIHIREQNSRGLWGWNPL